MSYTTFKICTKITLVIRSSKITRQCHCRSLLYPHRFTLTQHNITSLRQIHSRAKNRSVLSRKQEATAVDHYFSPAASVASLSTPTTSDFPTPRSQTSRATGGLPGADSPPGSVCVASTAFSSRNKTPYKELTAK